jgi:dihydroxyacetone kinase-like protein
MTTAIGIHEFIEMLKGATQRIRDGSAQLSELDSAIGDGDHGITMLRAVGLLDNLLAAKTPATLTDLTEKVAWTLLGVDGGSTGPLLGTFFLGISEATKGKTVLAPDELATAMETGLASLRRQTKAQIGDKTMIDALVPAVQALRDAAAGGNDIFAAIDGSAEAARKGALATKDFVAKFGKAKFSGERTLGHQDPGATSVALMFEGFRDGLAKSRTR